MSGVKERAEAAANLTMNNGGFARRVGLHCGIARRKPWRDALGKRAMIHGYKIAAYDEPIRVLEEVADLLCSRCQKGKHNRRYCEVNSLFDFIERLRKERDGE